MKLLLVAAATSTTGGAERHIADLLRRLPAAGIEAGLCCPGRGDLPALASELGIPVFVAPIEAGFSAGRVRAVRDAIASFEPHVVHAHGSRAAMFARVADKRASKRVVYTVHGIHIDKAGSAVRQTTLATVERRMRRRTARFVTVCDSDIAKGDSLRILDPARAVTVHNGIEARGPQAASGAFREGLDIAEGVPLALSVGRMHEQKDQRTLLDAWRLVVDRLPAAVLALIGSGPLEARLREHAVALMLGDNVRFVAPMQDLTPAYADADAFALSSRWEGLPYVILEAMDAGLPVVSTNVDGIPEAVDEGVTGLLAPPGDPAALADALIRVLSDPVTCEQMGQAGTRKVATDFTLGAMIEKLLVVYGEVAEVT